MPSPRRRAVVQQGSTRARPGRHTCLPLSAYSMLCCVCTAALSAFELNTCGGVVATSHRRNSPPASAQRDCIGAVLRAPRAGAAHVGAREAAKAPAPPPRPCEQLPHWTSAQPGPAHLLRLVVGSVPGLLRAVGKELLCRRGRFEGGRRSSFPAQLNREWDGEVCQRARITTRHPSKSS